MVALCSSEVCRQARDGGRDGGPRNSFGSSLCQFEMTPPPPPPPCSLGLLHSGLSPSPRLSVPGQQLPLCSSSSSCGSTTDGRGGAFRGFALASSLAHPVQSGEEDRAPTSWKQQPSASPGKAGQPLASCNCGEGPAAETGERRKAMYLLALETDQSLQLPQQPTYRLSANCCWQTTWRTEGMYKIMPGWYGERG